MDKSNHVGGTEIRNAKDATEFESGYTGDTYCLGCDDKLADGETIPATHQHTWEWTYDNTLHWQKCDCGESSTAAEGHLYDDDTDATCDKCGYTRTIEHTHEWGKYESNGDGSHTRICTTDNSHRQKEDCGGTATCHELATCPDCGASHGEYNKNNHVGGTEIRNEKEESEFEDGYTGDTYCKGCNSLLSEGKTIPATHVHSYSIQYSDIHHWDECSCGDTCNLEGHYGYGDDSSCDHCGYHVHFWNVRHNSDGTHTKTCKYDSSHVEIDNTDYGYYLNSDKTTHWKLCNRCGEIDTNWEYHVYDGDSDPICNVCGYRREDSTHEHRYAFATCVSPALCSCGVTSGAKNPNNHTGGTEIRNAAEATIVAEGYTGDTYCLGCGSMIASGEVIPKAGVIFDGPGMEDVTFIPAEGTELPGDAEIIVNPHTPSADDLDFLAVEDAPPLNVVENLSDVPVKPHEFGDGTLYGPGGKEYTFYEKLIINGEEYYVDGADADGRLLLFDKKGDAYFYDGNSLGQTDIFEKAIVPDNEFIKINGVVYQIIGKWSGLYALWLDGKPVGAYNLLLETFFYFNEEYAPDKVKERQQNSNQLGTVIPGESPVDGLESGKTYNVSVIGSNDISVPGAENVTGTITQTFAVPETLVGSENVKYVAVHKTANGNEIGTVALSEDGKTLTATYTVDSFSPFTVYAFTEAELPEIKEFVTQPDGTLARAVNGQPAATHTVASGENLTVIARKYGCTVDEIVALNSDLIENPRLIFAGWVLKIPQK